MGLCVFPVGLLNEFCVSLVGLRTRGAGVQLMKVLVAMLALAKVSSGNSVSSHSVEMRPLTLKPLGVLGTIKPRSARRWNARFAVFLPTFKAAAASRTL